MPWVHEIKCKAVYWHALECGDKTFEVRKNDRAYQTGDQVKIYCLDDKSAPPLEFKIGWILTGGQFGIEPGYIVFSLHPWE